MTIPRRRFLHLAAGATALPAGSRAAWAQAYPTRPVRIVVGFTAGSSNDIIARLIAQWLSERLGQRFIVEPRPGAGGSVAAEAVVRAAPDGYTLLLTDTAHAINTTLYENLSYNFVRDLSPITGIIRAPNVMVVHPSFPAKTVPEFIAYAKANPGKINMASAGAGGTSHMFGELFKLMASINMVHVPYRGQPAALTDLMAGQVQVDFASLPPSIEYVKAAKLHALAVTTETRWQGLPEIPALGEFVSGYEATAWQGLVAPRSTSAEIITKLNREIRSC
jgi:tripartite-type tricarboxylate transporter receptor subunit TctC